MIKIVRRVTIVSMLMSMMVAQCAYAGPMPQIFNNYRVNNYASITEAYVNDPAGAGETNITSGSSLVKVDEPAGGDNVSVEFYVDVDCTYTGTDYFDIVNGMYFASTDPVTSAKTWQVEAKDIEVNAGNEHLSVIGASVQGSKVNVKAGNITVNNETGSKSSYGLDLNDGNTIVKSIEVNGNSDTNTCGANVYNSAELTVEENLTVNKGVIVTSQSGTGNVVNILGTADDSSEDYIIIKAANEDDITLNVWKTDGDVKFNDKNTEYTDSKINYIIKDTDGTATYKNMTLSGGKYVEIKDRDGNIKHYYTATEGIIVVTVDYGYKLNSSTDCVGSGRTYTITIPEGGGVTIEAILEAIDRHSSGNGSSSVYTSGWHQSGNNWQYVKADGTFAKNEWLQIEVNGVKKWYHFGSDTMMDTGWLLDTDGSWYYLSKEDGQDIGTMQTGWMTDPYDGYRYYLDPATGKMLIGWHVVDGKRHYFNEHVPSASGWTQDEKGDWVYNKQEVIPLGAMTR